MAERKYYCLCSSNCKYETMTKEQILTAITEAVENGSVGDLDTGFITTIKTINGSSLRFFVGLQAEYEALTEEDKQNTFALITNDTTAESINTAIATLEKKLDEIENSLKSVEWREVNDDDGLSSGIYEVIYDYTDSTLPDYPEKKRLEIGLVTLEAGKTTIVPLFTTSVRFEYGASENAQIKLLYVYFNGNGSPSMYELTPKVVDGNVVFDRAYARLNGRFYARRVK